MSAMCQKQTFAQSSLAVIRSVELIVQPGAHDVVGEMGVRGDHTVDTCRKTKGPKELPGVSSDPTNAALAPIATILGTVNLPADGDLGTSFVQTEDVLNGIHYSHVPVLITIGVNLLRILGQCIGVDDRVVAQAVVVSGKP